MKLHYAETINGRKACAAAKHLEAPVAFVRIDLARGENATPAFKALNPNAKVPLLELPDRAIWESNAIIAFLARHMGSELFPTDDRIVEILRWLTWSSEHFTRYASRLYFEYVLKPMFKIGPADAAAVAEATAFVRRYGAVLDDYLDGRHYLVGDGLTIADFAVAAALPYAKEARLPLEGFTGIARWHDRLNALPAWGEPYPAFAA